MSDEMATFYNRWPLLYRITVDFCRGWKINKLKCEAFPPFTYADGSAWAQSQKSFHSGKLD